MDGGGFFSYPNGSTSANMGGSLTGCAAAFRLAKSARMANGWLTRWAAEMGGGGRRRRLAAEVGGGDGRRRWAAEVGSTRQHTAAHGSTRRTAAGGRVVGEGATVQGGRQAGRGNGARRRKKRG